MNINELGIIKFNNQVVIDTNTLAEIYETTPKNVSNNFNNNKDRFIEGKHYYKLTGDILKNFLRSYNLGLQNSSKIRCLYVWTERGANRHCKILDTDKAWEQFENLEETYFKVKENIQPKLPSYSEALRQLADKIDENDRLKEDNQKLQEDNNQKQKVINQFETAKGNILVRELAKIACKNGIKIGEKRLWEKLREWKMIFKNKTEPYQKYIERGYFEIKEGISDKKHSDGSNVLYRTTKVTPKGQVYILNKLVND